MSDTPETDAAQHEGLLRTNPIPMQVVTSNFARKLERERNEAREALEHITEYGTEEINAAIELRQKLATALVERDEATRSLEKERIAINYFIERGMRERDEASQQIAKLRDIVERAIDDLAWFSETNSQRLRAELDELKGGVECQVCTPEQKCWECDDDVSQEGTK